MHRLTVDAAREDEDLMLFSVRNPCPMKTVVIDDVIIMKT